MEEQTIDDLTEDLVLQCLVRLHYKDLISASWVCRKWRRLLQSRHFYRMRKQLGYTNQLACFLQHPLPSPLGSNSVFNFAISVLDPMSLEWNRLPSIPNVILGFYESIQIASSNGKLVVINHGRDHRTSLFVWDFLTQRWWKGKDLPSVWPFFFLVDFDGQIFVGVSNGNKSNSVWEYDMRKDEWTELPQMSQKLSRCHELKVIGDELWVLNCCNTNHIENEHSAEVYHFQTGKWRLVELDLEQTNDSSCPDCCHKFEFHELLMELPELNSIIIAHFSRLQLGAQSLVMVTVTTGFDNEGKYYWKERWEGLFFMRSQYGNFEQIHPISSEFATHVRTSCCVEV
ncbi:F-box/kelch-repeat protein At1g15670-like [Impatiens glandulifera]|uniref:F-box/kelch-repeat protein At1g15670-like n=1 Tax=Impatiens glandulifera TaxID=253017 RepID=UPI001FB0D102|nr:F-box/kelch-repeat protein At1g15670-like [Impatiens glandulifera]XP_047340201.1 F-box/kelch-repeat protein At1g15670-like [Impatiens glandulifera]